MFNADENTFSTLKLRSRRSTRGGTHANTVTTVDLDDNAKNFVKGAVSYLEMQGSKYRGKSACPLDKLCKFLLAHACP